MEKNIPSTFFSIEKNVKTMKITRKIPMTFESMQLQSGEIADTGISGLQHISTF